MTISGMVRSGKRPDMKYRANEIMAGKVEHEDVFRYMLRALYEADRPITHDEMKEAMNLMYRNGKIKEMNAPVDVKRFGSYNDMKRRREEIESQIEDGMDSEEYRSALKLGKNRGLYFQNVGRDRKVMHMISTRGRAVYEMYLNELKH